MQLSDENCRRLERVAVALGDTLETVTFVGGAVLGAYFDEEGAAPVRPTKDVDVVTQAVGLVAPQEFETALESRGFRHCADVNAPVCRWELNGLLVDVMHADGKMHGFNNRWFGHVSQHRHRIAVGSFGIFVPEPPVYVATKLDAHRDRGEGTFGQDLEDILGIINARPTISEEVRCFPDTELSTFVIDTLRNEVEKLEALGHLEGMVEAGRKSIVLERCRALFGASPTGE